MVSCTPRIHPFPASETRIAGAPRIAIRSQGNAASAMSPRDAITDTNGTPAASTTNVITAPMASASHVACVPSLTEAARSPDPKNRAARAVVPYDRNVNCVSPSTSAPMARPARGNAPRCPTTPKSNNTYSGSAASTPRVGSASAAI